MEFVYGILGISALFLFFNIVGRITRYIIGLIIGPGVLKEHSSLFIGLILSLVVAVALYVLGGFVYFTGFIVKGVFRL